MSARITGLVLLSLLLPSPGQAQTLEVRSGIFCDSQREVERFITLFDGDAESAMNAVNAEVNDPTPCFATTIALIRGPEVAAALTWCNTFHVVQVVVVGVFTSAGFRKVEPVTAYSIERVEERGA